MDRGAWRTTVHMAAKSQRRLKRLSRHPCGYIQKQWGKQPFTQHREFSSNYGCPTVEYAAAVSNVSL